MGLFGAIMKGIVRGARGIGGKIVKGIKSGGEKLVKGIKGGIAKVKQWFKGKPAEPKLSQTLRDRGAFKPKGKPKIPFEPPVKHARTRPLIDKGRALNDPVMTRQPSGFMGESI